jgi:hypothetical protein
MTIRVRRSPRRIAAAASLAAGCLLLAACSSASTPQAGQASASAHNPTPGTGIASPSTNPPGGGTTTGGSVEPCSLLTQAEVDTAVGQPLGPGKATIPNYDCQWTTTDFSAGVSVTVSDWSAIKTSATANGHTPTSVLGVGDEALYKGGGLLYVRKGTAGFLLSINGPHIDSLPDGGLAQEKVLAAAVLGRL